jgi:NTE family protein
MTMAENMSTGSSGLVLSGGGARAAYEVGVLKALLNGRSPATDYTPLDFQIAAGTSAGSVNACLLLSTIQEGTSAAAKYIEDVWLNDLAQAPGQCGNRVFRLRADPIQTLDPEYWMPHPLASLSLLARDYIFLAQESFKRGANLLFAREQLGQKILELVDFSSLISTDVFEKVLSQRIHLANIRSSPKALRISCTDWRAGKARTFTNSSMQDDIGYKIILASSAIPGVFPAVEIEGSVYVDGGVVMNTPLKPAIDSGADILHVIYADPAPSSMALPKLPNTAATISRALEMTLSTMLKQDIQLAAKVNLQVAVAKTSACATDQSSSSHREVVIHRYGSSQAQGVGWLSFGREGLRHLIDLGFKDTVEHDCQNNECVLPTHNSDGSL